MALQTAFDPTATGQPCHYWHIGAVHLDHRAGQVTLWLHGWAEEPLRRAGHRPAASVQAVLGIEDFPANTLHSLTTEALYAALLTRAAAEAAQSPQRAPGAHGCAPFAGAAAC